MELEVAASTVEVTDTGVTIRWSDGNRSRFHALWLRDNCSTGGERGTNHRVFSVVDLNPELFVLDAERDHEGDLLVEFSDGHESVFTFDWLRAHSHEVHDTRDGVGPLDHLRAGASLPQFDLPRPSSPQHRDTIAGLLDAGAIVVAGVPVDATGAAAGADMVAELFGGEAVERVLGDVGIVDARTDEVSAGEPAAVVVLAPQGDAASVATWRGQLFLVDGFAVAAELRDRDPDAFDALTTTEVPFVRPRDSDAAPRADLDVIHRTIIALDRRHEIVGVRFDESAMAPLDVDPSDVGNYYRALITFVSMLRDPGRAIQVDISAGYALVIDNHRMLRGGVAERNRDVVAMVAAEDFRTLRASLS